MTEIYRVRSTTTGGKVGSAMVKLGITGMSRQIHRAHANGITQVDSARRQFGLVSKRTGRLLLHRALHERLVLQSNAATMSA